MVREGARQGVGCRDSVCVAAVLLACVLVVAGCSGPPSPPSGAAGAVDAARLIEERCTKCHSTDRINLAEHDRAGWQATVDRMVSRGAQLSDTEKAAVVDYLASRQP